MENREPVRKRLSLAVVLMVTLATAGAGCCGNRWMLYFDKPVSGGVVDADSGEPIQGAVVVAQWELQNILGQGFGGYAKIIVETSDKEGKFKIPLWISYKPWKFYASVIEFEPTIIVYKPGYKMYQSTELYRKGDPTWPVKPTMTEEEKKKIVGELYFDVRQYSLSPVKLKKIYTDDERFKNYDDFESMTRFPDKYFSKHQSKEIFNTLEEEIMRVSDSNKEKRRLLKAIDAMRKYWAGGKQ